MQQSGSATKRRPGPSGDAAKRFKRDEQAEDIVAHVSSAEEEGQGAAEEEDEATTKAKKAQGLR